MASPSVAGRISALLRSLCRRGLALSHATRHAATSRKLIGASLAGLFWLHHPASLYNYARFDSPTDFGYTHQLAGSEQRLKDFFNLWLPCAGALLLSAAPARLSLDFPYFHLPPPPGLSRKASTWLRRNRGHGRDFDEPPDFTYSSSRCRFGLREAVAPGVGGCRHRVLERFGLLVAGLLSYSALGNDDALRDGLCDVSSLSRRCSCGGGSLWRRGAPSGYRALAGRGIALVPTALFGMAISMTGYSTRCAREARTYRALERFFSPLPTFATMIVGRPVLVEVLNPTGVLGSDQLRHGRRGSGHGRSAASRRRSRSSRRETGDRAGGNAATGSVSRPRVTPPASRDFSGQRRLVGVTCGGPVHPDPDRREERAKRNRAESPRDALAQEAA